MHPVRPLHPVRRRGRRRGADRLRRPRRERGGGDVPHRAVLLVLQRQHGADLSGRRADRHALPLHRPPLGPGPGRVDVHHLFGRLPGGRAVLVQPVDPAAGDRLGTGEPRLAVRQGAVRLRVGQRRRGGLLPGRRGGGRRGRRRGPGHGVPGGQPRGDPRAVPGGGPRDGPLRARPAHRAADPQERRAGRRQLG